MTIAETERLRLRVLEPEDEGALAAMITAPGVMRFYARPWRTADLPQSDDAERFGALLGGLSEQTRSLWRPHPFDQAAANVVCASIDHSDVLRIVATVAGREDERIVVYYTLKRGLLEADGKRYAALGIPLDPLTDANLAPCVTDEYQNRGLGSVVMRQSLDAARSFGRERIVLWGGVQARNERAIHFYAKWGFRKVGEFYTDKNNYDMILEL